MLVQPLLSDQTVSSRRFDAIVLGAGAAGLLCAARPARASESRCSNRRSALAKDSDFRWRSLQLHERSLQLENFISANPHFAKSALARFTPADFIVLVEKYRIPSMKKRWPAFATAPLRRLQAARIRVPRRWVKIFLNSRVSRLRKRRNLWSEQSLRNFVRRC